MRVELEFDFDLGCLGHRMGRVLADVEGTRVTLLAASLDKVGSDNFLPLLRLSTRDQIKERLKEIHCAQDAVYDWDGPEGGGAA